MLVNASYIFVAVAFLGACALHSTEEVCEGSSCAEEALMSQFSLMQRQVIEPHHIRDSEGKAAKAAPNQTLLYNTKPLESMGHGNTVVLVTGAAGFIGSHAALSLLEHGYQVVGVDDYSRGFEENIKALESIGKHRFTFASINIGDEPALSKVVAAHRPETIMHFAGVAYAAESMIDPVKYYSNNTENTLIMLRVMSRYSINNLVYSSSCATYGSPKNMPVTEESPQKPVSPYGRSKLQAEQIIRDWVDSDGFAKAAALRYFNVIGADPQGRLGERPPKRFKKNSDEYRQSVRILTALLDAAEGSSPRFQISGNSYSTPDGTPLRDYIHVTDLVNAHVAVLQTMMQKDDNLPNFRYYNVGTGKPASVLEMVNAVKKVTHVDFEVKVGSIRAGDPPAVYANNGKIIRETSWSVKFPHVEEAIKHEWAFRTGLPKPVRQKAGDLVHLEEMDPAGIVLSDEFGEVDMSIRPLETVASLKNRYFSEWTSHVRLAILISGQLYRFIYKDIFNFQATSLNKWACGPVWSQGQHCRVDVYAVLANTTGRVWKGKNADIKIPYMGTPESMPAQIELFYKHLGANHASVKLLTEADINNQINYVNTLVRLNGSKAKGMSPPSWWSAVQRIPDFNIRYGPHGMMFYLRHSAYSLALAAENQESQHTHFLYVREDNAFVHPDSYYSLAEVIQQTSLDNVKVDMYCGWGSFSDKMYLTGRQGADVLFASSVQQHATNMAAWLNRALDNPDDDKHQPLQTERWLQHLMTSSSKISYVNKFDFHRTDMRYAMSKACVPHLNYRCTANPGEKYPSC